MLTSGNVKLILAISIFIGILSIIGLITLIVVWQTKLTPFQDYGIVVDAGSSHSKIFVYTWPADKSDGISLTSQVTQEKSCIVLGGPITSIAQPTEYNVQQYFELAMSYCIKSIPLTHKSQTPIFLGGTGGLRLSEMENSSYTNDLLNGIRAYFNTLGLYFISPEDQVRILSGTEEGFCGWISTNILMGEQFEKHQPLETYGVLDMGGASTQITFVSPNATHDLFNISLLNTEYHIYSHSYLCYGTEQLRLIYLGQIVNKAKGSLLINDPCLQDGYVQNLSYTAIFSTYCAQNQYAPLPSLDKSAKYSFIGTGDPVGCANTIRKLLNKSICTSTSCSFDNVYQPKPIPPELKFVGISKWYRTFNELAPNVSLAKNPDGNYDFYTVNLIEMKRAIAAICHQPWLDVPNPHIDRPLLCFDSTYDWTLYEYGYSMTNENLKNFHIVKAIGSNEVDWTLGYLINQTNYLQSEQRPSRLLTKNQFVGLLLFSVFFLILSIPATIFAMLQFQKRRDYSPG